MKSGDSEAENAEDTSADHWGHRPVERHLKSEAPDVFLCSRSLRAQVRHSIAQSQMVQSILQARVEEKYETRSWGVLKAIRFVGRTKV